MSSQPPTDEEARNLIRQNNWDSYSQSTEIPDERRCMQCILQHQVRVEAEDKTYTRTLGELVEIASNRSCDLDVSASKASNTLGRHGLRVDVEKSQLFVSNSAEALAAILKDTAWNHSWSTVLSRLKGATKTGAMRFKGAGTASRAVALQLDDL
jgi:hypothetical protein